MKKLSCAIVLAVLIASAWAGLAVAQEPDPIDPGQVIDLVQFLKLLASGGGAVLIGAMLAFLFREVAWFQNLSPEGKKWISLALSVGLPVLAQLLILYVPAEVWVQLAPIWAAIVVGIIGWLANQGTYRVAIKPGDDKGAR